eukprot:1579345-Prymnesium_polylepis.1
MKWPLRARMFLLRRTHAAAWSQPSLPPHAQLMSLSKPSNAGAWLRGARVGFPSYQLVSQCSPERTSSKNRDDGCAIGASRSTDQHSGRPPPTAREACG